MGQRQNKADGAGGYLALASLLLILCFLSPGTFAQNFGQGQEQGQYPPQAAPQQPVYAQPYGQQGQFVPQQYQQGQFAPQQYRQESYPQSSFPGQAPAFSGGVPASMPYGQIQSSAQQAASAPASKVNPQKAAKVYQWFLAYDEIRRRSQMNPIEKQRSDAMLARGLGLFMSAQDKAAARMLLGSLVERYQQASGSLKSLAPLPETRQLQDLYVQYFETAGLLFSDYLKVQDNLFAVDNTGQSIAKQLIQRKIALENLEHSCKELDGRTRFNWGVAAYQY